MVEGMGAAGQPQGSVEGTGNGRRCQHGNWSDGDPGDPAGGQWEVTPAPGEDTKPWLCPEVLGEGASVCTALMGPCL